MRILNFGSVNIDYVYHVPHIVQPGETISSSALHVFAGGKGANQSVALARAGARVWHAGRVGGDGRWLIDKLKGYGVDTSFLAVDPNIRTGNAIIQVETRGENSIVLFPGSNHAITPEQVNKTLAGFGGGDVLLLQNELNDLAGLIRAGKARGLTVALNPAPITKSLQTVPIDEVDLLVVNEAEGAALTGSAEPEDILRNLPCREKIITLGREGAWYHGPTGEQRMPACVAEPVDTTAAGDTFIGYFLAARAVGLDVRACLARACKAAAICVTRQGAMDSIPTAAEVDQPLR